VAIAEPERIRLAKGFHGVIYNSLKTNDLEFKIQLNPGFPVTGCIKSHYAWATGPRLLKPNRAISK
jgi:hypothetical protein